MKFRAPKTTNIPWKDGAIVIVRRASFITLASKGELTGLTGNALNMRLFYESFIGWEGIVDDETDKPLKVTEDTKQAVADAIIADDEMLPRVLKAIGGEVGNLQTGSTASTTTDGTPETAKSVNAAKKS